jgi:hypothetical protein
VRRLKGGTIMNINQRVTIATILIIATALITMIGYFVPQGPVCPYGANRELECVKAIKAWLQER